MRCDSPEWRPLASLDVGNEAGEEAIPPKLAVAVAQLRVRPSGFTTLREARGAKWSGVMDLADSRNPTVSDCEVFRDTHLPERINVHVISNIASSPLANSPNRTTFLTIPPNPARALANDSVDVNHLRCRFVHGCNATHRPAATEGAIEADEIGSDSGLALHELVFIGVELTLCVQY